MGVVAAHVQLTPSAWSDLVMDAVSCDAACGSDCQPRERTYPPPARGRVGGWCLWRAAAGLVVGASAVSPSLLLPVPLWGALLLTARPCTTLVGMQLGGGISALSAVQLARGDATEAAARADVARSTAVVSGEA